MEDKINTFDAWPYMHIRHIYHIYHCNCLFFLSLPAIYSHYSRSFLYPCSGIVPVVPVVTDWCYLPNINWTHSRQELVNALYNSLFAHYLKFVCLMGMEEWVQPEYLIVNNSYSRNNYVINYVFSQAVIVPGPIPQTDQCAPVS